MFAVHLPHGFSSIKLLAVMTDGAKFGSPGLETDLPHLAAPPALVPSGSGLWVADDYRQ